MAIPTASSAREHVRLEAQASGELRWYFGEADADACGLRAVTWNVLEELDTSRARAPGPGVKRGAPPIIDFYPDERATARAKLRRVWLAFSHVPHEHRAILEAHFTPRGANVPRVAGLGPELSHVAALLPAVQRAAADSKRTRLVEARLLVAREGSDPVLASCRELVRAALAAYVHERFPQLRIQRHL